VSPDFDSGMNDGTDGQELERVANFYTGTEENPTSAQSAPTPRAEQDIANGVPPGNPIAVPTSTKGSSDGDDPPPSNLPPVQGPGTDPGDQPPPPTTPPAQGPGNVPGGNPTVPPATIPNPPSAPQTQGGNLFPNWEGFKAGVASLADNTLGSLYRLATGQAGAALGDRAYRKALQRGIENPDAAVVVGLVGEDVIGAQAVEGISGYDLATSQPIPGQLLDGGERSQRLASGSAAFFGAAALGTGLVAKFTPVGPKMYPGPPSVAPNNAGSYVRSDAPGVQRTLPKDKYGVLQPDVDVPHTQLGRSTKSHGAEPQAREWMYDDKGRLVPTRDLDFTDHNFPDIHPNPHQHKLTPVNPNNPVGGGLKRGNPEPF
jgi:hypothetical protein